MTKRALITGITGQDGAYLSKLLLEKGYEVYGTYRRSSSPNFWRLQFLGVFDKIKFISADLIDLSSLMEAITTSRPDEVYNLAAQSFVGASFEQPIATGLVSGLGVTAILEAIRTIDPKIKFYQASTSEMFGREKSVPQGETTPFKPASPYAAAKLYGYWITKIYREGYGIFSCNGILFNHESPLRGLEFVTRKVSNAVAKIHLGLQNEILLGNLDPKRDWGYAPEYVECMWKMLQHKAPDDYVVATNTTHTVRELVEEAFKIVDLDYRKFVKKDKRFFRPVEVEHLQGNHSMATKKLHWKPKTDFKTLIKIMVENDIELWQKWKRGEKFAWDAPYYFDESKLIIGKPRFDL
jgi:GDPmannose 4,6-dehydratase